MHPKTVILDIYEQRTFPQMTRLRFVTRNGWLNGLSLHALNGAEKFFIITDHPTAKEL